MRTVLLLVALLAASADAREAEVLFAEGVQAYAAEDYQRAMELFEQAAGQQPTVSRYHHWFGKACGRRAQRVFFTRAIGLAKKVRASFERAVELDGSNVQALADLSEYYLEAPRFLGGGEEKARSVAGRLSKLSPAEGHRVEATILANRKDYAGAERAYRQSLELEPASIRRRIDLALFLAERGGHAEASEMLEQTAALAPDSPEVLFARGKQLALSKKDPALARRLLQQYLRAPRNPDHPPPSEVHALLRKL